MRQSERQSAGAEQNGAAARKLFPYQSGEIEIILGGWRWAVQERKGTGDDPNSATMHPLQLSGVFHGAEVATNGLLCNTEPVCDIDNVHTSVSGEQVGDRLITSHGLRALDGHVVLSLVRRWRSPTTTVLLILSSVVGSGLFGRCRRGRSQSPPHSR